MTLRQSPLDSLLSLTRPYRPVLIFLRCMLFLTTANGSHLAGSEISYQLVETDRYEVTYVVYTDVPGSSPGNQAVLEIRSSSCNRYLNSLLALQLNRCELIDRNCIASTAGNLPVFKKWVYTGIAQLPEKCNDWKISVSECCRSGLINSISSPDQSAIYTEALINNYFETSSPSFASLPDFFVVAGQAQRLAQRMEDGSSDSVLLELIAPSVSGNGSVNFLNGYSPEMPIHLSSPLSLDQKTGALQLQPVMNETGVLAVRATAYQNGSICSVVQRESRIAAVQTNNQLPELSGFDGTNNQSMDVCAGNAVCFFLFASDPDQQDALRIEVLDTLPGAEYNLGEQGDPSLHCCWTPSSTNAHQKEYIFRVKVSDSRCPFSGTQVYTYRIRVASLTATVATMPVSCMGRSDGSAVVHFSGNQGTVACVWSPSGLTGISVNELSSGEHTVIITDESGCQLEKSITISGADGFAVQVASYQNSTCSNSADGHLQLQLPEMNGRYSCEWLPSGHRNFRADQLTAGNHQVTVTDQQTGCIVVKNYTISYDHQAPAVFLGTTSSACLGRSIELDPGTGFTGYQWQDGATTQAYSALVSGYYSVRVTDQFGCQGESSIHLEFSTCTEITDPLAADEIRIYPNPVQTTLRVDFMRPLKKETILAVTDVLGNRLMSIHPEADAETASLAVDNLPAGVYLLYIERDSESAAYRFIKQ